MNVLFNKLAFVFGNVVPKRFTANKCGHKTSLVGTLYDGDERTVIKIPQNENGNPDYCIECYGKMSIRCAWCGCPIMTGSPVTLYEPTEQFVELPESIPYEKDGKRALVGCMRWNCTDFSGDIHGMWVAPGKVLQATSPLELCAASFGEEKKSVLIVEDTHTSLQPVVLHRVPFFRNS